VPPYGPGHVRVSPTGHQGPCSRDRGQYEQGPRNVGGSLPPWRAAPPRSPCAKHSAPECKQYRPLCSTRSSQEGQTKASNRHPLCQAPCRPLSRRSPGKRLLSKQPPCACHKNPDPQYAPISPMHSGFNLNKRKRDTKQPWKDPAHSPRGSQTKKKRQGFCCTKRPKANATQRKKQAPHRHGMPKHTGNAQTEAHPKQQLISPGFLFRQAQCKTKRRQDKKPRPPHPDRRAGNQRDSPQDKDPARNGIGAGSHSRFEMGQVNRPRRGQDTRKSKGLFSSGNHPAPHGRNAPQ